VTCITHVLNSDLAGGPTEFPLQSNLDKLRRNRRISVAKLAAMVGVSRQTIYSITRREISQNAKQRPSISDEQEDSGVSWWRRVDSNHGPTDYESTIVALKLYMQGLARQNAAE